MPNKREKFTFPTRSYPYRNPSDMLESAGGFGLEMPQMQPGAVHQFVLGLNRFPEPMKADDIDQKLCDPFAEFMLKRSVFPQTLREILAEIDVYNHDPNGLPDQRVFLAADGGQIPWSLETSNLNRLFRFAIARSKNDETNLLISSSTGIDSPEQFLQVLGWDSKNQVYNYYERRQGTWVWAGNSHHALADDTRGQGPFDSHVNGSLVMKELRAPWMHWHSMNALIQETTLSPDDHLRNEELFKSRTSAHELETRVVRPGITRWNQARLKHYESPDGNTLLNVRHFLRQVLTTTTVNLVSSDRPSAQVSSDEQLRLPIQFFLNNDALLDLIELEPDISNISVKGEFYRQSLTKFDFRIVEKNPRTGEETYSSPGDSFFAFLVPEPAFEDMNVLDLLLQNRLISKKFAASLLMIDFQNPVFSARREELMEFVPETSKTGSGEIERQFIAAVEAAESDAPPASVIHEFLANWRLTDDTWRGVFEKRIENYFSELAGRARDQEGFNDWTRLAESRRRDFSKRPLKEFSLTTPITNIPVDAPALAMQTDGTVEPR